MAIKTQGYARFSLKSHQAAGISPIVAQIELTYRCPLYCRHCYTRCYNNSGSEKLEMTTRQMKMILDKCKAAGVVWLCFSGGDPLIREDFSRLYLYARKLGFIITVFSSLAVVSREVFRAFKAYPPFCLEVTLNAASLKKHQEITKTRLFHEQVENIKKLRRFHIPVKIKTKITRQNLSEARQIKKLVESLGGEFRPSYLLNAALDHDLSPCSLRIAPRDAVRLSREFGFLDIQDDIFRAQAAEMNSGVFSGGSHKLFRCAIGGNSFWVNSAGRMVLCQNLKKPYFDLLKKNSAVKEGFFWLNRRLQSMVFKTRSKCRSCKYANICFWCPALAWLETKSWEKPIGYFCALAKEMANKDSLCKQA